MNKVEVEKVSPIHVIIDFYLQLQYNIHRVYIYMYNIYQIVAAHVLIIYLLLQEMYIKVLYTMADHSLIKVTLLLNH